MRKIILFLLLAMPVIAFAQYPQSGNRMRLGWQTTADGLIFRGGVTPNYVPININNAYFHFDTVGYRLLAYTNNEWIAIADTAGVGGTNTDLSFSGATNIITLESSTGTNVRFIAGSNISLSSGGDSLIVNAISQGQTFSNSSTSTTHVIRLSGNGGSMTLSEGNGVVLTTMGSDTAGTVLITVDTTSIASLNALADTAYNIRSIQLNGEVKGAFASTRVDTVKRIVFDAVNGGADSLYKLVYNAADYTLHFGMGLGNISYQMGQELFYPPIINKTGNTIYAGQLLMVDTSQIVTGDILRVIPATIGSLPDDYILGVAAHNIGHDEQGLATWFGYVREISQANIAATGITLNVGDILYPSLEAGRYTNVEPIAPNSKATIAIVVRKPSVNNITLLVRPSFTPKLGQLKDIDLSGVIDGQTIVYQSSTQKWIPGSASGGGNLNGIGLANKVTFWQSIDTLTYDTLFHYDRINDRLGVGLSNPAFSVDVDSTYGIKNVQVIRYTPLSGEGSIYYGTGGLLSSNAFYNTGVGWGSLLDITQADNTTALGYRSLGQLTTGADNTAVGKDAMYLTTTGGFSTAIGYRSLYNNRNGNANVAVGYETLFSTDSTGLNVGVGNYALYYAKAGWNTGVGHEALGFTTTGGSNSTLGYRSLYRNTTGYQNTALGRDAGSLWQSGGNSGFNQNATNAVYVGFNSRGGAADANNEIVIGAGALGNGSTTATLGNDSITKTYLKGQMYFPQYATNNYSGTPDKYLAVDNTGKVIEVDAPTGGGGDVYGTGLANKVAYWLNDSTITYDTNLHWDSVNDRLGIGNSTPGFPLTVNGRIGIGTTQMLYLPTNNGSMFVGNGGGNLGGVNGQFNSFVGLSSGTALTQGSGNSTVGYETLQSLQTGNNNTAVGSQALKFALSNNNTGVGNGSLGTLNTLGANNNTALGYRAGLFAPSLVNITNAVNGVYIGGDVLASANGNVNEIVIGANAVGNGSYSATLGSDSITKTYLKGQMYFPQYATNNYSGTPDKYLAVDNTGKVIEVDAPTGGGGGDVYGTGSTNKVAYWSNDSTLTFNNSFHFNPSLERLGVGTSAPAEKIETIGSIRTTLGRVKVNTSGSQVIHLSNAFSGDSPGYNIWIGTGGDNDNGNDANGYNTAVGYDAMLQKTDGSGNSALGYGALKKNTSGSANTAIGSYSLFENITGQEAVGIGSNSLAVSLDSFNTSVGAYSLGNKVKGSNNTVIGYKAANLILTGNNFLDTLYNSTVIGAYARPLNESGNNEIVIGYRADGYGSNTVTIGNDTITKTYLKGQMYLPQYAVNDYSGTATKYLAIDNTGKVIEIDTSAISGGSINIYNTSDTLTGNRVMSTNTYDLQILGTHNELGKLAMVYIDNNDAGGGANKDSRALATAGNTANIFTSRDGGSYISFLPDNTARSVLQLNKFPPISGSGVIANGHGSFINYYLRTTEASFIETLRLGTRWSNAANGSRHSEFFITTRKDSTTLIEPLNILNTGQLQLKQYGSNQFTGTVSKVLAVDATGKVIETSLGGGTVTSITAGNGLTGGTITTSGTIAADTTIMATVSAVRDTATTLRGLISSSASGTGAANKVAFWTGTNTLSNNTNFHWDNVNGRLGIGTSSPSQGKVDVVGTATISTTDFISSTGTLRLRAVANSSANKAALLLTAYDASNLPCAGSIHVEPVGNSFRGNLVATYDADGSGGNFIINQFSPNSAATFERMRIDNTGNVGIGTTNPTYPLDVKANPVNAFGIRIRSRSFDNIGILAFSDSTGVTANAEIRGVSGNLLFHNGSGEQIRLTNTGNVGIGSTAPRTQLMVLGATQNVSTITDAGTQGGTLTLADNDNLGGAGGALLFSTLTANSSYNPQYAIKSFLTDGSSNGIGRLVFSGRVATSDTQLTEFMTLTNSGNLGINVTNPVTPLDILSNSSAAIAISLRGRTSDNISIIRFLNNNAGTQYSNITSNPNLFSFNAVANIPMSFLTNNTEKMRILANGDVGIGTTTPSAKLHVNGSLSRNAPTTITANYTVADAVSWLICNGTGTITLILPTAASWTGRELMIKTTANQSVVSNASNVVPLTGGSAGTAILSNTAGKWATLVSDGSNWIILQSN